MSHGRRLVGRHAIITGGSSGIGYATATALGRQGAFVSLIARGAERLRQAEEELNRKGVSVATALVDVTDAAALGRGIEGLMADQSPSDILITSVGITPGRPDATQEMTDITSFAVLEPTADGSRNYLREGHELPAEHLLVDKAFMPTLSPAEMMALVGGMPVLNANAGQSKHEVFTNRPRR